MTTKNGHNAFLKIPGFFIGAKDGQAEAKGGELAAQVNVLTAEEQSFLDGFAG